MKIHNQPTHQQYQYECYKYLKNIGIGSILLNRSE